MAAPPAPIRFARGALALFTLVATASPATATIIDSFTDPLPAHPSLPVSGATVLFLGSLCDAAACPPGTIVTNPQPYFDSVEQSGLPGSIGGVRFAGIGTFFEPNPGASGVLEVDPDDGGRLFLAIPSGPLLSLTLKYGSDGHHLNLDLQADGSDRFEIEILATPTGPFDPVSVGVNLGQDNEGTFGAPWANFGATLYGPGLLVVPYKDLGGRFEDFDHDVDFLKFTFVGGPHGGKELVVGEIRTASSPTPAAGTTWGRIKSAYRD